MGQKLIDKGTHWEIQEDGLASILAGLAVLTQGLMGDRRAQEEKRKEREKRKSEAATLQADLAKLAMESPEEATRLASAVSELLNPANAEKVDHEGEGLLTRLLHKDKHKELDRRAASYQAPSFQVTPQLRDERIKKFHEAQKAESESILAKRKNEAIATGLESDNAYDRAISSLVLRGVNPTPDLIANEMSKGKQAMTAVPYSPEWVASRSAAEASNLFKEFPDARPEDLMAVARAMFDPEYLLPEDVKKRMGKSATGQKMDLDKRTVEVRERELKVSLERLRLEEKAKIGEMAKYLVDNGGARPEEAMGIANAFIKTGKLSVPLPADRKKELDIKHQEWLNKKAELEVDQLRVKSPKFDQLMEMAKAANSTGDEDQAKIYLADAEKEFKRIHGVEMAKAEPGFFSWDTHYKITALQDALKRKAFGLMIGAVTPNIPFVPESVEKMPATEAITKGISAFASATGTKTGSEQHGGGPRPGEDQVLHLLGTQGAAHVTQVQERWKKILEDPATPPERRQQILEKGKQVIDAIKRGDRAALMMLLGERDF